jgi:hypothetical protein
MVSSSSPSTPLWSGIHPPSTPDSDKTIHLPSPLQQLLDGYIAVHRREFQPSISNESFHVKFGFQCIRHVKTLTLQFTGWASEIGIWTTGKPLTPTMNQENIMIGVIVSSKNRLVWKNGRIQFQNGPG